MGIVMQPVSESEVTGRSDIDYEDIVKQVKEADLGEGKLMLVDDSITVSGAQAMQAALRPHLKVITRAAPPVDEPGTKPERRKVYARPYAEGEKEAQDAKDAERAASRSTGQDAEVTPA